MALLFEHKTCSRCGGDGHYPSRINNGRCFKCGGKGQVLTARGQAAQEYLDALRHRRADEIKIGDLVFFEGFSAGSYGQPSLWWRVTEIAPSGPRGTATVNGVTREIPEGLSITGVVVTPGAQDSGIPAWNVPPTKIETTGITCGADHMLRVGFTKDEKIAQREKALAYQATLTKAGTVAKRSAREAA